MYLGKLVLKFIPKEDSKNDVLGRNKCWNLTLLRSSTSIKLSNQDWVVSNQKNWHKTRETEQCLEMMHTNIISQILIKGQS